MVFELLKSSRHVPDCEFVLKFCLCSFSLPRSAACRPPARPTPAPCTASAPHWPLRVRGAPPDTLTCSHHVHHTHYTIPCGRIDVFIRVYACGLRLSCIPCRKASIPRHAPKASLPLRSTGAKVQEAVLATVSAEFAYQGSDSWPGCHHGSRGSR